MRDHFIKYSAAYPLRNKTIETVNAVMNWIMHFGPLKILHCDNGSEFKGALLLVLRQHGIRVRLYETILICITFSFISNHLYSVNQ